mgnify:FL=1
MTEFQGKAVDALREYNPEALVITEESESGLYRPCFQVIVEDITLKKEMGRRYRKEETLEVTWYPPEGEEPQQKEIPIQLVLQWIAKGVKTEAEREKGKLVVRASISQILFMDEEEAALMMKLLLGLKDHIGEEGEDGDLKL